MTTSCPFNTEIYTSGLDNIGIPERSASGGFSILRREIKDLGLSDGAGPWPYLWVKDRREIDALYDDFRHLVTLTVVTQPGNVPQVRAGDAALLKHHYVYDPCLPPAPLSRRACSRLHRCEERASFEIVTNFGRRMLMAQLYHRLKMRRGLAGRYVDFPLRHFEIIAGLENGVFFEVSDSAGVGAMACGVVFGDMLQILHMASSDEGLRWNASYLLMVGLQRYARERRLRLLTGGMPDSGAPGLRQFKARWANACEPVCLLRIVNDREQYAALSAMRRCDSSFFPAYRAPAYSAPA